MNASLERLLDQYQVAMASPENQRRGQHGVPICVGMEEPVCWHHLWGYDINRLFTDAAFYCEETLRQRLWRFENIPDDARLGDGIAAWLGHYPEYTYVGMDVAFTAAGVPNIQTDHPMTRTPDPRLVPMVDFGTSGWMPRQLRWYEDINRLVGHRLQVGFQTWWRGPLDMAVQLRGYENLMADAVERPTFVHALLAHLVDQRSRWYNGYARHFDCPVPAGAVGDDWINVPFISPAFFADFVLPAYLQIERFHGSLRHVHSCGNQTPVQKHLLRIRSLAALEVSPWTDLEETIRNLPDGMGLGISVHPNDVLFATETEMAARLQRIRDTCHGRPFSLGTAGLTPIHHLSQADAFVTQVRRWLTLARQIMDS